MMMTFHRWIYWNSDQNGGCNLRSVAGPELVRHPRAISVLIVHEAGSQILDFPVVFIDLFRCELELNQQFLRHYLPGDLSQRYKNPMIRFALKQIANIGAAGYVRLHQFDAHSNIVHALITDITDDTFSIRVQHHSVIETDDGGTVVVLDVGCHETVRKMFFFQK